MRVLASPNISRTALRTQLQHAICYLGSVVLAVYNIVRFRECQATTSMQRPTEEGLSGPTDESTSGLASEVIARVFSHLNKSACYNVNYFLGL